MTNEEIKKKIEQLENEIVVLKGIIRMKEEGLYPVPENIKFILYGTRKMLKNGSGQYFGYWDSLIHYTVYGHQPYFINTTPKGLKKITYDQLEQGKWYYHSNNEWDDVNGFEFYGLYIGKYLYYWDENSEISWGQLDAWDTIAEVVFK